MARKTETRHQLLTSNHQLLISDSSMPIEKLDLSVIVPVYNAPRELRECLAALTSSFCPGMEIVVADDASTDDTRDVASQMGVRVVRLEQNSGPSAARNYGARHSRGQILLFVDADVVIAPGLPARVLAVFRKHEEIAAVFGSYDAFPRAKNVVSQFRNLLHHYVHQKGNADASTFWAGCGAIRRSVFETVGGFGEERVTRPLVADVGLGERFT